jgi:phospholipid/cholesterol/gamma-HCH transport system substrate-binding protein
LLALLLGASVLYLLYARGAFERTQALVLLAEDSEGVRVGMDMTFSGFPIGRVRRIALAEDGTVRITVDVPVRDARWLRSSSVFVLMRNFVGGTSLRAYTGVLDDPPLPPDAERRVLVGDATAEIPDLVRSARELVVHLTALAAPDSALSGTLAETRRFAERLNGPGGALGAAVGDAAQAQRLVRGVESTVRRADQLMARLDEVLARADQRVLGESGMLQELQSGAGELRALLGDLRASLGRVDAVLEEARGIAGNVRGATADLDLLRAEVEHSLRRVDQLLADVQRHWPFARDTELRLP